jgi:hypothetical protein
MKAREGPLLDWKATHIKERSNETGRETGMNRMFVVVVAVVLPLTLGAASRASADSQIVVGDGTATSCSELALRNALFASELSGGRTIVFQCGKAPVTIALVATGGDLRTGEGPLLPPAALTPPNNTTIDGGGLITLEGTWPSTVLHVAADTKVHLTGLSITGGSAAVFNQGTLRISNSTMHDNGDFFGPYPGSGIFNEGALTVTNSTFLRNGNDFSSPSGGIANWGTLTVDHSAFSYGASGVVGGIGNFGGSLEVKNSVFFRNLGADFGAAGAIYNFGGDATIKNSEFSENHGGAAGAIANTGSLTVEDSTFVGNGTFGSFDGGAMINLSLGSTIIRKCEFLRNRAHIGGAITNGTGPLLIIKSTFANNEGNYAGAIYTGGALTVTHSRITGNTADSYGAAIYVVGGVSPNLVHTSVTDNTPTDLVVQP